MKENCNNPRYQPSNEKYLLTQRAIGRPTSVRYHPFDRDLVEKQTAGQVSVGLGRELTDLVAPVTNVLINVNVRSAPANVTGPDAPAKCVLFK